MRGGIVGVKSDRAILALSGPIYLHFGVRMTYSRHSLVLGLCVIEMYDTSAEHEEGNSE
jgi:hypothetical protein